MSEYCIQFAPTLDRPPETMVGETVYDAEGNAIGWIVNAVHRPDEPEEVDTLKLHERMNAALLDYESAMGIEGGNGANTVPFVIEMHRIIEDAAKVGVGTCHMRLAYEEEDTDGCIWPDHYECDACGAKVNGIMPSCDTEIPPKFCPNCGKRIEVDE